MRNWLRSPTLLKYFVGQHIVNGLSVAAAVMCVSIVATALLGFATGQPATLGAIGASVSDFPGPLRTKARTLLIGFALALISTSTILLAGRYFVVETIAIGAIAFVAGLVTGWGRWALALSMQMLVPMVFMMGLPPQGPAELLRAEILFAIGGFAYIALALGLSRLIESSDRRMMASECFRELAEYLRTIARFCDPDADLTEVYGASMRQQTALSEQLQAARALLLTHPRKTPERIRLAATIGLLLDVFDALVASLADLPELRENPEAKGLLQRIGIVIRAAAIDLQHLSIDLLRHESPSLPRDHGRAFAAAEREAARILALATVSDGQRAAVEATMRRLEVARSAVLRLEHALADHEVAATSIGDIDLAAFEPRRSFDLRALKTHLTAGSPVLRYATRLSLAMMTGGVVAHGLGYEGHGNWVLLTIAVVLRASYGLTVQRRNDRLVGTLVGCGLAAACVSYAPASALVALQGAALALTHSFVRLNYLLASIGASMVALIALHLASPGMGDPVLVRLADTIVGAAIANMFLYLWPSWELVEAPRLARGLVKRAAAFAAGALDAGAADQAYRLARKELIEGVAALSDSATRMGGEPRMAQRGLDAMAGMLVRAGIFAAQVSAIRLDARAGLEPPESVESTGRWIAARLGAEANARAQDATEALLASAHHYERKTASAEA